MYAMIVSLARFRSNKAIYKKFMSSYLVKFKKYGLLNDIHNVSEKVTFYVISVKLGYKYKLYIFTHIRYYVFELLK